MPDRWGRIGYNDFMGITMGLRNIQAMGQKKAKFDEEQQFIKDSESNLQALNAGPQQARPYEVDGKYVSPENLEQPVELTGSERSKIAAKEAYSRGLDADLNIADKKMGADVSALSEKITAWKTENPNASFDQIPISLTAGVAGQKAKAKVIGLYGESAEAQKKFMENRMPIIREHAENFFNNRKLVNDALTAGKTDMAINGLVQMSKELSATPYQLGEFDPETQSFTLNYFDRRTGKLQKSGTKSLNEVVQEMNALGEKEFINITAANMEAKRKENVKEEANPKHGKTSGGTDILITAQIDPMKQDSAVAITVRDEKTGETIANYPSWDAFYDAGNSKEDLDRAKKQSEIGAIDALKGQREDKAEYHRAQTAALGGKGGKYREKVFHDDQGNKYTAKDPVMEAEFLENGWTIKNPKLNKDMYENNVKAFIIQVPGFSEDMESGVVSGIISEEDWGSALKVANDKDLSLMDEHGRVVDTNGIWPGGKQRSVKVTVMPMGTSKGGGGPADIKKKVGKFDSDGVDDGLKPSHKPAKPTKTNAMGSSKAKTIITQMSKDEIKDIYRFGAFDEPGTTPLTAAQKFLSHSQSDKHEKFGEGPIEKALRDTGIEADLQKQKTIAKTLKSKFPNATEAQIVAMIKKASSKEPEMRTAMGGR